MNKALILLKLIELESLQEMTRLLYRQAAWVDSHPEGSVRVVARDARAHEVVPVLDVPELEVALELGLPTDAPFDPMIDHIESLMPSLAGKIDPSRSIAIAGPEHVLVTGDGPFQLYRCFGRRSDISLQRFRDHFLNIHSQFGKDLAGRPPYRQLHRDEVATERLRAVTGFDSEPIDGVAQLFFYGPEAFNSLGGTPERAKEMADDSALFIDPDTRRATIATVVLAGGPIR